GDDPRRPGCGLVSGAARSTSAPLHRALTCVIIHPMPELPDVVAYLDALRPRVVGARLRRVQVRSPFLVRSVAPPLDDGVGRVCGDVTRLGKRIVLVFEGDYFLAIHLMIAGRLMWKAPEAKPTGRVDQAALNFDTGALVVIEASPKKRAALHAVAGWEAL